MLHIHKFAFSIAYADTDAGGIVYHGRYIEIAERARMQWLRGHFAAAGDLGFVVREIHVRYLRPLRLGDDFVVESAITKRGAASMDIEQKFVKDNEIYAIVNVQVAYLGADMRVKRILDEIMGAAE